MLFLVRFIKGQVNFSCSFHIQEGVRFLKLEALSYLSQGDIELIAKIAQNLLNNAHRLLGLFLQLKPKRDGKNDLEVLEQDFIDNGVALRCSLEIRHIFPLD